MASILRAFAVAFALLGASIAQAQDFRAFIWSVEEAKEPWLYEGEGCPADLTPERPTPLAYDAARCQAAPEECLASCRDGDANACFSLALQVEAAGAPLLEDRLHRRSCALGLAIGCVNQAAGPAIMNNAPDCARRTFEQSCDAEEPWGCAMAGFMWAQGQGGPADLERAEALATRACAIDSGSEGCDGARKVLAAIKEARRVDD